MIFLLAIQQGHYSAHTVELSFLVQDMSQVATCFESNDSIHGIFGGIPSNKVEINFFILVTDCFKGNPKSKDVQSGFTYSVAKSNLQFLIAQTSFYTRFSAVRIPIYLQTANLLL
jgi:hypothetical protein